MHLLHINLSMQGGLVNVGVLTQQGFSNDSNFMWHALQIDKLHAEVMKQVKDLYLSHRHLHGWKE